MGVKDWIRGRRAWLLLQRARGGVCNARLSDPGLDAVLLPSDEARALLQKILAACPGQEDALALLAECETV